MPIIAPVKQKKFEVEEREALPTRYSAEFLASLLATPELIRNVAVVGHLHHGKTLVSAGCSCEERRLQQGGAGCSKEGGTCTMERRWCVLAAVARSAGCSKEVPVAARSVSCSPECRL